MSIRRASSPDFSSYIYVVNLVDELPLNMMSREQLESIVFTELMEVEKFRFEEETGAVWLTAFIKFYRKEYTDIAIQKLNTYAKIGAATVDSLFESYRKLEDVLKHRFSSFCTFSFIIVEQIRMNLTHDELISLFNNYGLVKIARTSPPMCIGYEKFTEALAAKIDQNRWNDSVSYIAVKIFPRMKEHILGFLKARDTYSLRADQRTFDPSLCVLCSRELGWPQSYNNGYDSAAADFHPNSSAVCLERPQVPLHFADDINSDPVGQISNADDHSSASKESLSFDPNDFVFYLRIESKALKNLDKTSRCSSSTTSDTGVSSVSSNVTDNSETGSDMHSARFESTSGRDDRTSSIEIALAENDSAFYPPVNFADPYYNYSYPEDFIHRSGNPEDFSCSDAQLPPAHKTGYSEYDHYSYRESDLNSDCLQLQAASGFSPIFDPRLNYEYAEAVEKLPEIEKHFELYGMKSSLRDTSPKNDPKILLVPFVYYKDKENQIRQTGRNDPNNENDENADAGPLDPIPVSSPGKNGTGECSNTLGNNDPPAFNDDNFPSLSDASIAPERYTGPSLRKKPGTSTGCTSSEITVPEKFKQKDTRRFASNFSVPPSTDQYKGHDVSTARAENCRSRGSRTHSFNKPSRKINIVLPNRSKSASRFKKDFPRKQHSSTSSSNTEGNEKNPVPKVYSGKNSKQCSSKFSRETECWTKK